MRTSKYQRKLIRSANDELRAFADKLRPTVWAAEILYVANAGEIQLRHRGILLTAFPVESGWAEIPRLVEEGKAFLLKRCEEEKKRPKRPPSEPWWAEYEVEKMESRGERWL